MGKTLLQQSHGSAGAEHADGHEYGDEVGYDADGCFETIFGTVDKGLIDIDFAYGSLYDKPADDAK